MSEYLRPSEQPPSEPEKVIDERYQFRGHWDREPEAVCRVRYFIRTNSQTPVLMVTELPENPSTSITNAMEYLAPQVIRDICPERFEHLEPVVLIEHYPEQHDPRGRIVHEETYDRVSFASWAPRMVFLGGQQRLSFGQPDWRRMAKHEVMQLIGPDEMITQHGEKQ